MKTLIRQIAGDGAQSGRKIKLVTHPIDYDEDITWIHIKFKSMEKLLADHPGQIYFDAYGNMYLPNGRNSGMDSDHFCYLGQCISFKRGHWYDSVNYAWLVETIYLKLPKEFEV